MTRITVGTLARGRQDRLANLMRSLDRQTRSFDELVIACMQDKPYDDLPTVGYAVRQIPVRGERLPLASARNGVAREARGDVLVYLDVDCIAAEDLVDAYASSPALRSGECVIGEVRYLGGQVASGERELDSLWQGATAHPARAFGSRPKRLPDHGDFWSLSFALTAKAFERSGGFDEAFEGYGGEDTDFAASLARAGIGLSWVPEARAVHQWHAVSIPPLQHLDDIVRNASLFRRKHGRPCMEYWTDQLIEAGYVGCDERTGELHVRRRPSAHELEAAIQGPGVRFS